MVTRFIMTIVFVALKGLSIERPMKWTDRRRIGISEVKDDRSF